jgi:hypothetical protein
VLEPTLHRPELEESDVGGGDGGGYGARGGGEGAGGEGGEGIAAAMGTHFDPTPFPLAPPSHTLGCCITVMFVPLGKVAIAEAAGAQGMPFSAPYFLPPPASG